MDSTKKQVSDIERQNKNKRLVIRFLKEVNLLVIFRKYINTGVFLYFAREYTRKHNAKFSTNWYDRELASEVFGCCNFSDFVYGLTHKDKHKDLYALYIIFLYFFDYNEYVKYTCIYGAFALEYGKLSYDYSKNKGWTPLIKKWKILSEIMHGDKN